MVVLKGRRPNLVSGRTLTRLKRKIFPDAVSERSVIAIFLSGMVWPNFYPPPFTGWVI
jgi:hypothetical protein